MKNKAINTIWFPDMASTIGIVFADNGREKKIYIKRVRGKGEEEDIRHSEGVLKIPSFFIYLSAWMNSLCFAWSNTDEVTTKTYPLESYRMETTSF